MWYLMLPRVVDATNYRAANVSWGVINEQHKKTGAQVGEGMTGLACNIP